MRTVGFSFWVKVGVSGGLFGLAALLLLSERWQTVLFGFQPGDAVLGPVVAVLVQGAVLAAILAGANWYSKVRPAAAPHDHPSPRLPAAPATYPSAAPNRLRRGAFEVAAHGIVD